MKSVLSVMEEFFEDVEKAVDKNRRKYGHSEFQDDIKKAAKKAKKNMEESKRRLRGILRKA